MSTTGWICPRCRKVHAPFVQSCDCSDQPDLIGKPLPSVPQPDIRKWVENPFPAYPMPICGCTGPCANAACPHAPKTTCGTFGQLSITNGGNA